MIINGFKDFMNFWEASFTEKDIPPYFYVGIYFSEDLLERKPYTPTGAVATLVGLEGISETPAMMSMGHGAHLKMPGKDVVKLNKIVKHLYRNPEYMVSRGFSSYRRTASGSGGPYTPHTRSKNAYVGAYIRQILISLGYHDPISMKDGSRLNFSDFIDILKSLKPIKGGFRKEWKYRGKKEVTDYLKTLKSATDLAKRIYLVLSGKVKNVAGVENPGRLLEPYGKDEKGRDIPRIFYVTKKEIPLGSHESEQEWILKRQLLPGDPVHPSGERNARPILNVPEGSSLYLSANHEPPWFYKYLPEDSNFTREQKLEYIVKKFGLYNKYDLHFVDDSDEAIKLAKNLKSTRPFDPSLKETSNTILEVLKRLKNVKLAIKLLEKKGITASKVKALLARWEKLELIKLDGDSVVEIDKEFDEDEAILYNRIKSSQGVAIYDLSKEINSSIKDTQKVLEKLISKDKIEQLPNDTYAIKLSPKQMKSLSLIEKALMVYIKKHPGQTSHYTMAVDMHKDTEEIIAAIYMLTLKGRIYKGVWSNYYRITPKGKLNKKEQEILDYMKEWPSSDRNSLRHHFEGEITKPIESLAARNLVKVEGNEVSLNTDKVKASPSAKPYSMLSHKMIDVLHDHFFTNTKQMAKAMGLDSYDNLDQTLHLLINKGVIDKESNNGRLVTHNSLPAKDTVEGKQVLKLLSDEDISESNLTSKLKEDNYYFYYAAEHLYKALEKEGLIKSYYHPIDDEKKFHLSNREPALDMTDYKEKLLDIMHFNLKPLSSEDIQSNYNQKYDDHYMSNEGIYFLLNKLKEEGKVKETENFMGTFWHLPYGAEPKDISDYGQLVLKIIKEKGPMDETSLGEWINSVDEEFNTYYLEKILKTLTKEDQLKEEYDDFLGRDIYYLEGQKLKTTDDYKEMIMKMIEENFPDKAFVPKDIRNLFNKIYPPVSSTRGLLRDLAEEEKLVKQTNYKGDEVFHLPNIEFDSNKELKDIIIGYLTKVDFMSAEKLAEKLYTYQYVNKTITKNVLEKMAQEGTITKYEDPDAGNDIYSLKSDLVMKPLEEQIIELLKQKSEMKPVDIYVVYSDHLGHQYQKMKQILDKMILEKKIFIVNNDGSEDYWNGLKLGLKPVEHSPEKIQKIKETILEIFSDQPNKVLNLGMIKVDKDGELVNGLAVRKAFEELLSEKKIFSYVPITKIEPSTVFVSIPPEEQKKKILDYMAQEVWFGDITGANLFAKVFNSNYYDGLKALLIELFHENKIKPAYNDPLWFQGSSWAFVPLQLTTEHPVVPVPTSTDHSKDTEQIPQGWAAV